jgi:hypothetical protein
MNSGQWRIPMDASNPSSHNKFVARSQVNNNNRGEDRQPQPMATSPRRKVWAVTKNMGKGDPFCEEESLSRYSDY